MENNSLEDILNEPGNGMNYNPINNNDDQNGGGNTRKPPRPKKSKKPILIIIMLLLLIIIAIVVVILLFLNKTEEVSAKLKFFEYLGNNNVNEVFELETYNDLGQKMLEENYTVNTEIEVSATTDTLKVDNVDLIIDSERDNENNRAHSKATLNYSDNELLNLELLMTDEAIGINSKEITNGYLGASYEYILENIVADEDSDFDITALLAMFDSNTMGELANLEVPSISESSINLYKKALDKEIDDTKFASKNVTLSRDSGNIKATEYSLKISSKELMNLVKTILRTFETDTQTISSFENYFSMLGLTGTDIVTFVDTMLQTLEQNEYVMPNDDNSVDTSSAMYTIKVYESNGKMVKLLIESTEDDTLEIEFDYSDTENSIKLTQVDESKTGSTIIFTNTNSDLVKKFTMETSYVEYGEINSTLTIDTSLVDAGSSYTMNNNIIYKSDEVTVGIKATSKIKFEDVTVTSLTPTNCTFVDDLSEEELQAKMTEISEKAQEVFTQKLLQLSFIDSNLDPTIIEQNPNGNDDDNNNQKNKEEAKSALMVALQGVVDMASQNGEAFTLENIKNIEIPNYNVSVALRDDVAVVTVDDFVFYININADGVLELSE